MKDIVRMTFDHTDWEEVLSLILRSFEYMDGIIDPPSSANRLTAQILKDKARTDHVFGVFIDGKPVACIFCTPREDCLYVGKLAIDTQLQGKGYGKRLMKRAEAHALQLGYQCIELQVRVELDENRGYFEELGFSKTGETAHEGYDRTTSFTFRKWLD